MRQVSHMLDTEHRSNLELLGRLEQAFARAARSPAARDAAFAQLNGELGRMIEHDTGRHFDFEERELFPRLVEAGDGHIAAILQDEHDTLRAVGAEILPLVRAAAAGQLADSDFAALRQGLMEVIERQVSHVQKETMALLPMLEDLLDDDTDRQLSMAYAST